MYSEILLPVFINGNKTTLMTNLNIYFTICKTNAKVTVSLIMSVSPSDHLPFPLPLHSEQFSFG